METRALLAWLLELIRRAPEPVVTGQAPASAGVSEAIELVFRGRRFLIRVEEVASA